MRAIFSAFFAALLVSGTCGAAPIEKPIDKMPAADIVTIKDCDTQRETRPCEGRDAIFFVHGIFGGVESFTNGDYRWPQELSKQFPDVDIFVIEYKTQLLTWLYSDVATFDQISEVLMTKMQGRLHEAGAVRLIPDGFVNRRGYRSVGFIAHSLGGNVTAAYLHSVKSELGHVARAQNAYLITLGTPADGSYLANVGNIIKSYLPVRSDPLLTSLEKDNLFLRMLAIWRRAEHVKAQTFKCRAVNLWVGVEGASYKGLPVVTEESARKPYERLASDIYVFRDLNHLDIAAPKAKSDKLNEWVTDIIRKERQRVSDWGNRPLCSSPF